MTEEIRPPETILVAPVDDYSGVCTALETLGLNRIRLYKDADEFFSQIQKLSVDSKENRDPNKPEEKSGNQTLKRRNPYFHRKYAVVNESVFVEGKSVLKLLSDSGIKPVHSTLVLAQAQSLISLPYFTSSQPLFNDLLHHTRIHILHYPTTEKRMLKDRIRYLGGYVVSEFDVEKVDLLLVRELIGQEIFLMKNLRTREVPCVTRAWLDEAWQRRCDVAVVSTRDHPQHPLHPNTVRRHLAKTFTGCVLYLHRVTEKERQTVMDCAVREGAEIATEVQDLRITHVIVSYDITRTQPFSHAEIGLASTKVPILYATWIYASLAATMQKPPTTHDACVVLENVPGVAGLGLGLGVAGLLSTVDEGAVSNDITITDKSFGNVNGTRSTLSLASDQGASPWFRSFHILSEEDELGDGLSPGVSTEGPSSSQNLSTKVLRGSAERKVGSKRGSRHSAAGQQQTQNTSFSPNHLSKTSMVSSSGGSGLSLTGMLSPSEKRGRDSLSKSKPSVRLMTAFEYLTTEENYVTALNFIHIVRDLACDENQAGGSFALILPPHIMFAPFARIRTLHETILVKLRNLLDAWDDASTCISDVFKDLGEDAFVKAYRSYFESQAEMQNILIEAEKHPRCHGFLRMIESRPEAQRQSLKSFLIRPTQRLPSMTLLFERMLKHSPPNHPDHDPLERCYTWLKNQLSESNERLRTMEKLRDTLKLPLLIENLPANIVSSRRNVLFFADAVLLGRGHPLEGTVVRLHMFRDVLVVTKFKVELDRRCVSDLNLVPLVRRVLAQKLAFAGGPSETSSKRNLSSLGLAGGVVESAAACCTPPSIATSGPRMPMDECQETPVARPPLNTALLGSATSGAPSIAGSATTSSQLHHTGSAPVRSASGTTQFRHLMFIDFKTVRKIVDLYVDRQTHHEDFLAFGINYEQPSTANGGATCARKTSDASDKLGSRQGGNHSTCSSTTLNESAMAMSSGYESWVYFGLIFPQKQFKEAMQVVRGQMRMPNCKEAGRMKKVTKESMELAKAYKELLLRLLTDSVCLTRLINDSDDIPAELTSPVLLREEDRGRLLNPEDQERILSQTDLSQPPLDGGSLELQLQAHADNHNVDVSNTHKAIGSFAKRMRLKVSKGLASTRTPRKTLNQRGSSMRRAADMVLLASASPTVPHHPMSMIHSTLQYHMESAPSSASSTSGSCTTLSSITSANHAMQLASLVANSGDTTDWKITAGTLPEEDFVSMDQVDATEFFTRPLCYTKTPHGATTLVPQSQPNLCYGDSSLLHPHLGQHARGSHISKEKHSLLVKAREQWKTWRQSILPKSKLAGVPGGASSSSHRLGRVSGQSSSKVSLAEDDTLVNHSMAMVVPTHPQATTVSAIFQTPCAPVPRGRRRSGLKDLFKRRKTVTLNPSDYAAGGQRPGGLMPGVAGGGGSTTSLVSTLLRHRTSPSQSVTSLPTWNHHHNPVSSSSSSLAGATYSSATFPVKPRDA